MYKLNSFGTVLDRCEQIRNLGIINDNRLFFVQHIEHVTASAIRPLRLIGRNTFEFKTVCAIILLYDLAS